MFTINNLIKTLFIAVIVGLSYGFYEASTAFQSQSGFNPDQSLGRIGAFIEASKTMEARYFWPHLLKQWVHYCVIIFVGCGLLLAVIKSPNKFKNENASDAGSDVA